MKKILSPLSIIALIIQLLAFNCSNAQTGTWAAITNLEPNNGAGLMLLMTDGTIMCQSTKDNYTGWDKLTPDASGSYINGTWTTVADMNQQRLFFASQVLPSGKLFVAGGEYGFGDTAGEVYDPVTNIWTRTGGVVSKMNIYDGNSILLPDGQVLVGPQAGPSPNSTDCQFFNPATNRWALAPSSPLDHDESQWLKLPDSSILFIGIASTNSCRYRPQTNTWVTDATVPENVYDTYGEESGCGALLPNGKGIFFGATKYNVIYTPSGTAAPGTWATAANFPTIQGNQVGQTDAPGAMMVNGNILLAVSPVGSSANDEFRSPAWFLEYDYTTNTFTQVTSAIPGLGADSIAGNTCSNTTFLDLPDGTVLMMSSQNSSSSQDQQYYIYTPGSGPIAAGKPTINSILPDGCPFYKITGKLFNGISEGTEYGDDLQQSSNYPLVRLTNGTNVYYAKTTNWNRIGAVMTDSLEDTAVFETPAALPSGTYSLVVIVNGFASNPTLFTVLGISSLSQTNVACAGVSTGSATVTASGGLTPLSYSWSLSGGAGTTASNLSAGTYTVTVTDNNGCTVTAPVTITQPPALNITADSINTSGGNCNGSAWALVSGGTGPYTYSWTGGLTTDTITNQCTADYCATVTDANGCTGSVCINISVSTGINQVKSKSGEITVYPNPNNGQFTIQSSVASGQSLVEIYSVLGEKVYSQFSIFNTPLSIDLSSQPSGVYFYRVIKIDGSLVGDGKIVIQK